MKKILRTVIIVIVVSIMAMTALSKLVKPDYAALKATIQDVDPRTVADGVYDGSRFIFPVSVKARVTVSGGVVREIALLRHFNGQGKPAEAITASVIEAQSLNVDAITGATHSSLAILGAIEDALEQGATR